MKIFTRLFAPLLLGATLPWAAPAIADTIDLANSLSQTNANYAQIYSDQWHAQAFTTDATHTTVTAVATKLSRRTDATGTLNLYIYSSASNKPDSSVALIGSYNIASQLTTTLTDYTLSSLNVGLSPNTEYFLVLGGASVAHGEANWGYTSSTSGTGFPSYYTDSANSGATWNTPELTNPQQMRIQATSSDIPEPASVGLMGIGMVGWFLTRRRTARG